MIELPQEVKDAIKAASLRHANDTINLYEVNIEDQVAARSSLLADYSSMMEEGVRIYLEQRAKALPEPERDLVVEMKFGIVTCLGLGCHQSDPKDISIVGEDDAAKACAAIAARRIEEEKAKALPEPEGDLVGKMAKAFTQAAPYFVLGDENGFEAARDRYATASASVASQEIERLRSPLAKIMQWVKAHPRKATICQSVIDEADAALSPENPNP